MYGIGPIAAELQIIRAFIVIHVQLLGIKGELGVRLTASCLRHMQLHISLIGFEDDVNLTFGTEVWREEEGIANSFFVYRSVTYITKTLYPSRKI